MSLSPGLDRVLRTVVAVALDRREAFDALDAVTGDGDFGSTVARGAAALAHDPPQDPRAAGLAFAAASGGSSGALLGAGLVRLAEHDPTDAASAAAALKDVDTAIYVLGEADLGDKTLRDVLYPTVFALRDEGVAAAVATAREAADATADLTARRGRSAYAGDRSQGAPDPGAVAVAEVLEAWAAGEPPSWDELAARAPAPDVAGEGDDLVDRALLGLVRAHPGLERLPDARVIVRRDRPAPVASTAAPDADPAAARAAGARVAVVSGGGAGHEPMHAGFVGEGMLAAACPGAVFTSPSTAAVIAAAEAVDAGAGVLFVVKNYTGDALNFGLAAQATGVESATVMVADDVATPKDRTPGRRGTGATIAVEKLVGAAAARGVSLDECWGIGQDAANDARSFGIAFHGDEMEPGVGIHGEPGRPREPLAEGRALAEVLLEPILAEVDTSRPQLVLLSGLGGTAPLVVHAIFAEVATALDERGVAIERRLVGDLITSMDQPGVVLTLLPLDDARRELWDAPVRTPALRWG